MKTLIKKIVSIPALVNIKNLLRSICYGWPALQPFYARLYKVALSGMTIDLGWDADNSGERECLRTVRARVLRKSCPVVFDVGANVGQFAQNVLSAFGQNVSLYCFEPSREAFIKLQRNFRGRQNVRPFNCGFGRRNETGILFFDVPGSPCATLHRPSANTTPWKMKYEEQVEVRRIDDFCLEHGIEHIDYLKLDVEGHELSALEGCSGLLHSGQVDIVQFEFGQCNLYSRTFFHDLFSFFDPHFRVYRIIRHGLYAIERYSEQYEVFLPTNFLAVSRKFETHLS